MQITLLFEENTSVKFRFRQFHANDLMSQNMALNDSNKLSHKNSCFTSCNHAHVQKLKVPRLYFLKITNLNDVKGILNEVPQGSCHSQCLTYLHVRKICFAWKQLGIRHVTSLRTCSRENHKILFCRTESQVVSFSILQATNAQKEDYF